MKYLLITLVLMTTCSQMAFTRCQRRMPRPNPVMGALQNLFMPGAAAGERAMRGILPVNTPFAQIPRELDMPNVRAIQPKCGCQQEIIYSQAPQPCQQVLSNVPLPVAPLPAPAIPTAPLPMAPLQPEILYPFPLIQEKCPCSSCALAQDKCPCSSCASPAPLVSPFLPAASPVSAWAPPTSNLLPPVIPNQSRSHFLRKVPIPPPSL